MLRCLLIKRKLYDYLEGSLSQIQKIKVKSHLEVCSRCKEELYQLKNILDTASIRKIPQPSVEFWHNFKVDLDRNLNEKLMGSQEVRLKPRYYLKPAFAYILVLIFTLVVGNYLWKRPFVSLKLAAQNEARIDEMESLDEEIETPELNQSEDGYIDELNLIYELDQA